ncbi:NAD(P)H-binding protein [Nocardioides sp. TF02-7]|uniref:NAD(P)-dependent oxidoreductase n=1 Tax=Nocardioides sp. TF02-7 TaxID=2917724 RepID=UPI001F05A972|nr:NAD(P)H-binding protein [Nocardioides sp. TF02-7]UMG92087.1 NAD(P)H-binding protein [Nocardioides sp. TF02-7]
MKITVLGATGTVGRHVVEQALAAGHHVTALVRDPDRLDPSLRDDQGLHVLAGDATDHDVVARAVAGADAVVVALGAGRAAGIREAGTSAAVAAMKEAGVERLVCVSTLGAGDSRANLSFVWKRLMFGMLLRKAYADHQRQEEVVRSSGLVWTLVRPAAYTDGPLTGRYRHGFGPDARDLALQVSRADVAHFVLDVVTEDRYVGAPAGLSY